MLRCMSGEVGVPVFACAAGCGERQGVPMGCNARLCPRCVRKLRRANQAKIIDLLLAVDHLRARQHRGPARWRFVTLTIRSRDAFLPMRRELAAAWGRLLRRKFWRQRVRACVACFETTHTKAGWHVHVHALVDAFLPRAALVRAWTAVSRGAGTGAGVDIRSPRSDDRRTIVAELGKYIAKDLGGAGADESEWGVSGTPGRLAEFYLGCLRWRVLRTYGDAYSVQGELEQDKPSSCLLCEFCGEPMAYLRTDWGRLTPPGRHARIRDPCAGATPALPSTLQR